MKKLRSENEIIKNWKEDIDNPLLSISCLTYNHEKYIEATIKGFLIQETNFRYEVIIHDDASMDATANIIKEYEEKYPSIIKPIYQKENQWTKDKKAMSEQIFNMRKGKYIALCEGDDFWTDPTKIQKQVDLLEAHPEYSSCFHPVNWLDEINNNITVYYPSIKKEYYDDNDVLQNILQNTICSTVFRKENIEEQLNLFEKIPYGDMLLHLLNARKGYIAYIDEVMATYRRHLGGVYSSSSEIIKIKNTIIGLEQIKNEFDYHSKTFLNDRLDLLYQKLEESLSNNNYSMFSQQYVNMEQNSTVSGAKSVIGNDLAVKFFGDAQESFKKFQFPEATRAMRKYKTLIDYSSFTRKDNRFNVNKKLSIIIVAYNTKQELINCVQSIMKQSCDNYEVIIVDNGGNDEVVTELLSFPLLYVKCPVNLILSEGRNIGVHFSRGEIVAFLDDDALVAENYVETIIEAFDTYDISGFRGKVLPKTESKNNSLATHYDFGDTPIPASVDTEGNSAFLREEYLNIGGMDSLLFGGEGTELSYRLSKVNGSYTTIYWPKTKIFHDFAFSDDKLEEKSKRHNLMRSYMVYLHPQIYNYHNGLFQYSQSDLKRAEGEKLIASRKDQTTVHPKISICIPTYNRAEYLKETVESATKQTYDNIEIIVVDDGSKDRTKDVIKQFDDTKIKYFKKKNSGGPDTRNRCIKEAKGDFILWLDDDDLLYPDAIESYVKLYSKFTDVDIFYGELQAFGDDNHHYVYDDWYNRNNDVLEYLLIGSPIPHPGTMIRKAVYDKMGGYNIKFKRAHDFELWSRIAMDGSFKLKHLKKIICKYRIHSKNLSGNLSSSTDYSYEAAILKNVVDKMGIQKLFPNQDWSEVNYNKTKAAIYVQLALRFFQWDQPKQAIEYFIESLEYGYYSDQKNLLEQILKTKNAENVYPELFKKLSDKKDYWENELNQNNYIVLPESKHAHNYLDGLKGVEIGASSHNPFGLNTKFVGMIDRDYEEEQRKFTGTAIDIDIEALADDIPLPDESEDFVVTSHVVEHCPNLVKTLVEWYRIIKKDGFIYMIVPKRDASPSDKDRPLTDWSHIYSDYKNDMTAEKEPEAGRLGHCHYHVFTMDTMISFVESVFGDRLKLVDQLETDDKVGNGFTLVYKKVLPNKLAFPWKINNGDEFIDVSMRRIDKEVSNKENKNFVNIGMVTYNRLEFTKQSIDSITKHTSYPYVLTVVDNNSNDGSKEYLSSLKDKGIIKNLLLLEENLGVAKASNLAWSQEPDASYYLKLDNDIVIQKDNWLQNMVTAIANIPKAGAVAYNFEPNTYPVEEIRGIKVRPKKFANLGGACIMIPKRTHNKLGYWCEDYGLYGEEDADYGLRIRLAGLENLYLEDEDIGIHLPGGKAAVIDPHTFEARDGAEENIHESYRKFKDQLRRDNKKHGGIVEHNFNSYANRTKPLKVNSLCVETYFKDLSASIIIVTYNSSMVIADCIKSLKSTIRRNDEVVIVDNNSKDNTLTVIKRNIKGNNQFKVIESKENLGFSAGSNLGIENSSRPFVVLLNPDTVVTKGWLEKLSQQCSLPNVAAVGPVSNYAAGLQNLLAHFTQEEINKIDNSSIASEVENRFRNQVVEAKLLIGFCMMIDRNVIDKFGALDPELFLGNDDLDLSWRFRLNNYKLLVVRDTLIFHEGQVSFKTEKKDKTNKLVQESTDTLYKKLVEHYGDGNVPSPEEIWGMHWFEPSNPKFNPNSKLFDTKKATVSIVIPTFNQWEYTKQTIESIEKYTNVSFEIVIVDNASTDETRKKLDSYSNVKLVTNNENEGFPKAVNKGIVEATGKYVMIANNDIVVTDGWLDRMIELIESDPKIGIVGPISNSVSGYQIDENAKYKSIPEMHTYADSVRKKNKGKILDFPRVAFLCTLIKKEVIEKIGGLDERFSPGNYEDDDYCLRAQLAGYKTVIAQDVFIHHFGSKSFKADGDQKYIDRLNTNKEIFVDKWGADPNDIWLHSKEFNNRKVTVPISNNKFKQNFERGMQYIEEQEFEPAAEAFMNSYEFYDEFIESSGYDVPKTEVLNLAGNVFLVLNLFEEAKILFENQLKLDSESGEACLGLGQVFYEAELYSEAKTMFEFATEYLPENDSAKFGLQKSNDALGLTSSDGILANRNISDGSSDIEELIEKGELNEAKLAILDELSINGDDTYLLNNLVVINIMQEKYDTAAKLIEKILTIEPNNETALNNLKFLDEKLNNELQSVGSNQNSGLDAVEELIEKGEIEPAKEALRNILVNNPQNIDALNNLVVVLILEGKLDKASEAILEVLKLDPTNEIAKDNLNYLEELVNKGLSEEENK